MPTTTKSTTLPPTMAPTKPPKCEDSQCVESWLKSFNVCHKCPDFAEDYCGRDELFMQSCPKSCRQQQGRQSEPPSQQRQGEPAESSRLCGRSEEGRAAV